MPFKDTPRRISKRPFHGEGGDVFPDTWSSVKNKEAAQTVDVMSIILGIDTSRFFWRRDNERERATFWVWGKLILSIMSGKGIPPENVTSSKTNYLPRMLDAKGMSDINDGINIFIPKLGDSSELLNEIINSLNNEWSNQVRKVKKIKWLSDKSVEDLEWAYSYLDKKGIIPGFYEKVAFHHERKYLYRAIIGAIDLYSSGDRDGIVDARIRIIENMKRAYAQNKRRHSLGKCNGKAVLSAEISIEAKKRLDEIAKAMKKPKSTCLEYIILSFDSDKR